MSDWHVLVGPIDDQRFIVWLLDFKGLEVMAEDRGPGNIGYTEAELQEVLGNAYGLASDAISSLIRAAKLKSPAALPADLTFLKPDTSC